MRISSLLGALAVTAVVVASAAAAGPAWRDAPGIGADQRAVWAAGRLWFFDNGTGGGPFTTRSAPVQKLSAMVKDELADTAGWDVVTSLQDSLVLADRARKLWAVALRADGTLGQPAELAGAPAPASSTGEDFARLRDRVVSVANANPRQGPSDAPWIGACCDHAGRTVDYHSFVRPGWVPRAWLGVDRRGRLWLAWAGTRTRFMQAGLVELDPATLMPRGAPAPVPSLDVVVHVAGVVCSDTCRVVAQGLRRGVFAAYSWAYGETSSTRIRLPGERPSAFAARDYAGRLVVAYRDGQRIGVVRGDARGAGAKLLAKVDAPSSLGSFAHGRLLTLINGTFGPGGLAVVALYEGRRSAFTRVAILRF